MLTKPCNDTNTASNSLYLFTNAIWLCLPVCLLVSLFTGSMTGGKTWGNLIYARHIITYSISPFEQRVFAGFFTQGPINMFRRAMEEAPFAVPPIICGYLIYYFASRKHSQLQRKQPEDYTPED